MTRLRVAAYLFTLASAMAQPAPPRAFEVATIKPSPAEEGNSGWNTRHGVLTLDNQTLKSCLRIAHRLQEDQVSGGPKWLDSLRFNIVAKPSGPASGPELFDMLKTLLAERFQLETHWETKSFAGYALVPAKSGFKLTPVADDGLQGATGTFRARIQGKGIPMATLAELLTSVLRMPVEDRTGIAGMFNVELTWTPDDLSGTRATGAAAEPAAGPTIFTALQEQLGLKLESRKVERPVLFVDRAEMPSAN